MTLNRMKTCELGSRLSKCTSCIQLVSIKKQKVKE